VKSHSLVAGANALFRAKESARPDHILEDGFAALLGGKDLEVELLRFARFLIPPLFSMVDQLQTVHCVRHASIDQLVLEAVKGGARQVVLVGAGYDMRVMRFPRELDGVTWIEVDHPATAEQKRRRLAGLPGWAARIETAVVDLLGGSLTAALAGTSFARHEPTCFVLEGLVHYLPRARLEALLAEIAGGPATLVLSFIRSDMYRRAPGMFIRLVQLLREVPHLHFSPGELRALCEAHGFRDVRSFTYDEQVEAFAPAARGRRHGVSQDVAVARR
jgi:methyltransferase (TIGR00027 family)